MNNQKDRKLKLVENLRNKFECNTYTTFKNCSFKEFWFPIKTKGKSGSNYTLHTISDLELARNHFGLHWFIHGIGKKGLLRQRYSCFFFFFSFLFFLLCKSKEWFLRDSGLCHNRVKVLVFVLVPHLIWGFFWGSIFNSFMTEAVII